MQLSYPDKKFNGAETFDLGERMTHLRLGPEHFYSVYQTQIDKVLKDNKELKERIKAAKTKLMASSSDKQVLKARTEFQRVEAKKLCQELKGILNQKLGKSGIKLGGGV